MELLILILSYINVFITNDSSTIIFEYNLKNVKKISFVYNYKNEDYIIAVIKNIFDKELKDKFVWMTKQKWEGEGNLKVFVKNYDGNKEEKVSEYFKHICVILFISFLFSCEKFKRNPYLELLLKDNRNCFFNPVWSPDGKNIYYLSTNISYGPEIGMGGELWKINLDTREKKFLLKGPFCALAISPYGDLLALSYETGNDGMIWEGGPLILADTAGNILDTISTSLPLILDVEFSSDGSKLYYYAYNTIDVGHPFGFYRINIDGSEEELIERAGEILDFMKLGLNFDLDKNDSLIYGNFYHPQILYRENNKYIIFCTKPLLPDSLSELKLFNASSHKFCHIDASPYKYSSFQSAYFSPDGEKLIISVGEFSTYAACTENLELWILHKIWR